VRILVGDILQSKAQTLINTVNCVGIMGKGIALEFKIRFSEMFKDYAERCKRREVKPGVPYLYKTLIPPQVINFPTKDHWKSVSKLTDIERGLTYLLSHYRAWGVTSLAIPPLGCGNGQLEWRAVGPLIYRFAKQMDISVELYAPYGTSPRELTKEFLDQKTQSNQARTVKAAAPALDPAWVALVEIVKRIEEQPYHWPIGRTIFQKIAYVATSEGLPTGLQYQKGSFGPFSRGLKEVEAKLINNNMLQEKRFGKMFMVKTGPNYDRVRSSHEAFISQWSNIIDKSTDLFMRINTNQAEIITTILFAARELVQTHHTAPTETEVLNAVMRWKQKRRPPVDQEDVASTIRNLGILRWLNVKASPDLPLPEEEALTV
jgi:O-acetyl-ADP-ribose deacetylase (regulator of RNase III)/uncharacterized protein YwgA